MKISALIICMLIFVSACHKVKDSTPAEDRVAKATTFIDKGDYKTAIDLLEDTLKYEDTYEVRLVLASAYAGQAGVKVDSYWDYLVGFDAFAKDKPAEILPDLIPADKIPDTLDAKSKKQLDTLNANFKDLLRLEKKANKAPLITPNDRHNIYRARTLLDKTPTASAKLYRSMLTVVLLKSEIQDGKKFVSIWSDKKFDVCYPIALNISSWLVRVIDLVSEGLDDLAIAYPGDRVTYKTMRKDVQSGKVYTDELASYQKSTDTLCKNKK